MDVIYTADVGQHDHDWSQPDIIRFTAPVCGLNDRLSARWYKTHPRDLFPDADLTIWVDACLQIVSPTFVADVADQTAGYTVFAHPDRDNVTDELAAADTLAKYAGNRHPEMLADLTHLYGSPDGLYALTVIARRGPNPIDEIVWHETLRWSTRHVTVLDQLIFPFAATGVDVFDRNLWHNDWFHRHPHQRDT